MLDLSQARTYDFVTRYSWTYLLYAGRGRSRDAALKRSTMPSMRTESLSLMSIRPIRQMRFSPGWPTTKNAEDFAMLWDTYEDAAPHSIVHELTFLSKKR